MEEQPNFFQNPFFKTLRGVVGFVIVYLGLGLLLRYFPGAYFSEGKTYLGEILLDVLVFAVGCVVWMVFFTQFILPVKKIGDRVRIVSRLVSYMLGWHGPALFIENGIIQEREGESKKKGPGVIWLDSASAAVLRTSVRFTRTIGPGVHFTSGDEYIAATADLHTLTQTIGPDDKDEPFETKDEEKSVKERFDATSAMTRDGIIVSATIAINFRIKSKPGEGNTRFGFDPKNTEAAIRDSLVRGAPTNQPIWSTLPAKMAADLWREYLGKFRLNELFEISAGRSETTIQVINDLIKKRLAKPTVEVLDNFGRPKLTDPQREREYALLLKQKEFDTAAKLQETMDSQEFRTLTEMGLEVTGVTIKRLIFAPDIEARLVSQWTTMWQKNAIKERDQVDRDRKLWETLGQEDALKDFALEASREIARNRAEDRTQALEMLVHSTFRGVQRNPSLLKRTNTEQRELAEIVSWLRNLRGPSA
jgi:hypothetical protein